MSVKLDEVLNSNPLDYRMAEVRSDSRVIERVSLEFERKYRIE